MALTRSCDLCKQTRPEPSRYTMQHKTRTFTPAFPERVSTLSAGGIDLCAPCWQTIAQPRKGKGGHQHRLINQCDRCKERFTDPGEPLRYTLKVSFRDGDKVVTRGAGSVVLCRQCWVTVGKSKMRKGRHDILRHLHVNT